MTDPLEEPIYRGLCQAHAAAQKTAFAARDRHVAALAKAEPLRIAANRLVRDAIDHPSDFAKSTAYARAKGLVDFAEAEEIKPAYALMMEATAAERAAHAPYDAAKRLRQAAADLVTLGLDPSALLMEWASSTPRRHPCKPPPTSWC